MLASRCVRSSIDSRTLDPLGFAPYRLAAADLNADGATDVVVGDPSGTLAIVYGDGRGSFSPKLKFELGVSVSNIIAGDLDGDSHADLAIAEPEQNAIEVRLGPTFNSGYKISVYGRPSVLMMSDFDTDGHMSLACLSQLKQLNVLYGDGTESFAVDAAYDLPGSPRALAATDLNRDQLPDIVVTQADQTSSSLAVFLGVAGTGFEPHVDYTLRESTGSPWSLLTTDVDADGNMDVAVVDGTSGTTELLRGYGNGALSPAESCRTCNTPLAVTDEDFNRDGHKDLGALCQSAEAIKILLQQADGSFLEPDGLVTADDPTNAVTADLNRDGVADLIITNDQAASLSVYVGRSAGDYAPRVDYALSGHPLVLAVYDANGDS